VYLSHEQFANKSKNKGKNKMRTYFSKRWGTALRVTTCLFFLLACKLPQMIAQQVAGQPPADPIPADVVFGPGTFNLMDPSVGLSDLASYKATLTLSFNGTQAGQPSQWSHTYVMLSSKQSAAHQITIEAAGGDPAPFIKTETNGVSYEISAEGDCTASTTVAGASLTTEWEPAGFLSAVIGADAAGSETINGVTADKYTFDERSLGETGFTKSTGQIWVASENGVVVKYLITTIAGADYFGEGIEGSQTWEYNLTEIDQPVTIHLPAVCPRGLVFAPLMPAAQNVRQLPGLTTYSFAGSIQDVLAFYQEQMSALGWTATGEPGVADTMGVLVLVQGDQQFTVIATLSENTITVRLVMGTAPTPSATP
jgi:hypothetical protein